MAVRPPQTSLPSPLGRPACGLICRPQCGLVPWLTEVGPHTAPSSRQSHPGPLRGLCKDQQTSPSSGNFSGSPRPDRQSWDREALQTGPPGEQAAAYMWELSRRPRPPGGQETQTASVLNGAEPAGRPPSRGSWTRQAHREPGSQEAGDPLPSHTRDPGGSLLCRVWVLTKGVGGPTWLPVLVTGGR